MVEGREASGLGWIREVVRGPVVLPGDKGYDEARRLFNGLFQQRPGAIVYAADTQDVAALVPKVHEAGLRLTVRSGGTSPAGFSANDGGVVLDLSRLAENVIMSEGDDLVLGPGLTWGYVYPNLPEGRMIPGGECAPVSVSGVVLGGGLSLLSRSLGLAADHLVEATVVTASGEVLTVSETQHEDLFWALRGAGASYGVTTSLRFKSVPFEPEVLTGFASWDLEGAPEPLRRTVEYMQSEAPRELSAECYLRPQFGRVLVMYNGPPDEGQVAVDRLFEAIRPQRHELHCVPYSKYLGGNFEGPKGQFYAFWRSAFIDGPPSIETLSMLRDGVQRSDSEHDFVSIEFFNGAVQDRAADETAFVHRDRLALLGVFGNWVGGHNEPNQSEWAERLYESVESRLSPYHYQNYPSLEVTDWAKAYFGANYARLQAIKSQYDPDDVFHFQQSVRVPSP